ncbi:MAG: class I SAM-dependent methyltransferase [bacterium]|nr:class I SAM-dependent methyltransferase [Candidatus Kapabacteria bacterium]
MSKRELLTDTDKSDSEWFADWFASDYYLKLYSHRDHDEAEECIDLILRATGFDRGRWHSDGARSPRALDLATGPARHAIALARRGFVVTAVDLSPTLLNHARAEAERAGVSITFIESDMRAIEFSGEFDLGVQLFSSFGYFDNDEDDMLVLRHMHNSLHAGGHYALDLMNERWLEKNLVKHSERSFEDIEVIEDRWIADGRVVKRITIPTDAKTMEFTESVRLFAPDVIEKMLRDAGLVPEKWFGDYDGTPYDSDGSKRMIIISRAV